MNPGIFKAYDIRGVTPSEFDVGDARRIAKVLSKLYQPKRVLVGRDMRTSSPGLEEACIEGFITSGVEVVKIGMCSTPMFNFAVGSADGAFDLGVMITASHNPAKYNGMKLVKGNCTPIGQGSGMEEIKATVTSNEPLLDAAKLGSVSEDPTVLERYLQKVITEANMPAVLPTWRLAVDAGNGMNGILLPKLTKQFPRMEWYSLFWEPDGTFPNHEANPLKVETLELLQEKVQRYGCAFGVAFDGDGDRVGFVDETGAAIPGDMLTALFAREMIALKGPGKVLYDLRSSWAVPELIESLGGTSEMCKVGHAHIKRQMRETGAIFAGELSMHFYFGDFYNCEASDFAMLLMMKLVTREQKPLSQIWKTLQKYHHSGEINFTVTDAKAVMTQIAEQFSAQQPQVSTLDGIRLEFRDPANPSNDWWFNLRASNTEPLLRLNLEAKTQEKMQAHLDELKALIQPYQTQETHH